MRRALVFMIISVSSRVWASNLGGNLNLSYQGADAGSGVPSSSLFSQVANFYTTDRIFYSNDMTLGAFILHSKVSGRSRDDFRVRYSLNLYGRGYNLYSSYSPYTLYRPSGAGQKFRVFQGSLTIRPAKIPEILASYASTKQNTTDRTQSGLNQSWNIGTQFARSFGAFRGVYQRQQSRSFQTLQSQKQVTETVNMGYNISMSQPAKVNWSAEYGFTNTKNWIPGRLDDKSRTHNGALQASRSFGRRFSLSSSFTGRLLDFRHETQLTRLEDLLANGAASVKLRENISLTALRGYSLSQSENDTTTKSINDFINFGGAWTFPLGADASSRLALSRGVYYVSVLGHNTIDNATLIIDTEIYRRTSATINLGISRSQKTPSGYGKYKMDRILDIVSRPVEKMSIGFNYQSSQVSDRINFVNRISENISVSATHIVKYYFNYTLIYNLATYELPAKSSVSTISVAANYRLSRAFSVLATYTRRDFGSNETIAMGIDQTISGRLSWIVSARSNLTLNYSVSRINTFRQTQSFGGYYTVSF